MAKLVNGAHTRTHMETVAAWQRDIDSSNISARLRIRVSFNFTECSHKRQVGCHLKYTLWSAWLATAAVSIQFLPFHVHWNSVVNSKLFRYLNRISIEYRSPIPENGIIIIGIRPHVINAGQETGTIFPQWSDLFHWKIVSLPFGRTKYEQLLN